MKEIPKIKPLHERDNIDLLELTLQIHARAIHYPSKEMHDAYVEARQELEKRLTDSGEYWKQKCESGHLSIDSLLQEFTAKGFDTSNWDGDEGAERAIVNGVCSRIDEVTDKLFDTITEDHIKNSQLKKDGEYWKKRCSDLSRVCEIVLTSVGVEITAFKFQSGKLTDEEDNFLTDAITKRILRVLKENNIGLTQLSLNK